MKKLIVLVIFSLSLGLNAQDTSYGIKAGINFSNLTGDLGDGASTRTSIHAGLMLENKVSNKFGASLELLYTSLGAEGELESGNDGILKLEYLNVPIIFKYYATDYFALEAGPQIGVLVSSDVSEPGTTINLNDEFNDIDLGFNFGASFKLDSGLMFGIRYYLGLEDIATNENVSGNNRAFFLSTGIFF